MIPAVPCAPRSMEYPVLPAKLVVDVLVARCRECGREWIRLSSGRTVVSNSIRSCPG